MGDAEHAEPPPKPLVVVLLVTPGDLPPRVETEAERKLRLALRISCLRHTFSMAQLLGIYPA